MILFVGDKPSPRMKPGASAFQGAACEKRLKEWIKTVCYGQDYKIFNASEESASIWCLWAVDDGYPIIALGNNASKALASIPHFKLPNPSGSNSQINDKEFIQSRLEAAKKYILLFPKV